MDATPAGVPRGQQGTPFTASNRRIASSPTQANDDRDTPVGSVYDVVIVGARCAGASLAMLLARRGRRVLVVERAGAGTNTLSTHALVRPAVTLMSRWGILNRLVDASTPAVRASHFHYDDDEHLIDVRDDGDVDALYAPRRTVLDPILVAEARDAGAQVAFNTRFVDVVADHRTVAGVVLETNAGRQTVSANVVVGADGARSSVASRVGAPYTWTGAHAHALTMRYLHDEADGHFSWWFTSAGPTAGVFPTNSGSLMFVAEPASTAPTLGGARLAERMDQLLSSYFPKLSARLEASSACPPMHHIGRPGFARRAGGPGWVLVGDAGVFTDPMSQHGIAGAMRDAAFVVDHIEHALEHGPDTQDWRDFEADRDRHAIPILTATDLSITPGIGIDAIQQSHRELSGLIRDENLEIRRRTSTLRTPNAKGRNLEEQPCVS